MTLKNGITQMLQLTEDAEILLKVAASEEDGLLIKVHNRDEKRIQTMTGHQSIKMIYKWEIVLKELISHNLIADNSNDTFTMTPDGWKAVARLNSAEAEETFGCL